MGMAGVTGPVQPVRCGSLHKLKPVEAVQRPVLCVSDGVSLELTTPRLGRPILHLARLFASSSIKFRPCLLKAWAPNKSRPCPLERSNQVRRVLSWVTRFSTS